MRRTERTKTLQMSLRRLLVVDDAQDRVPLYRRGGFLQAEGTPRAGGSGGQAATRLLLHLRTDGRHSR